MHKKIAVIGAGPAGISAAVEAERSSKAAGTDLSVTVFEHLSKPLKKILATGNGRCNFTNKDLSASHFYGDKKLIDSLLHSDYADTESFFKSLGVLSFTECGRIYPRSESAASVRDALLNTADALGIKIKAEAEIKSVRCEKRVFYIDDERFDALIVAGGGKASPVHGSDGSAYKYLTDFGHTLTKTYPALTAFKCNEKSLRYLKGTRVKGRLTLSDKSGALGSEYGEIQFTQNSVSGIPAFMLSQLAKSNRNLTLSLDLFDEMDKGTLFDFLSDRRYKTPFFETEAVLSGIIPSALSYAVMEKAGIEPHSVYGKLTEEKINRLSVILKALKFEIDGVRDFESAQITVGGIDTGDFSENTLMSKKVPGLFACGEILNIHGDCGGYNLQLAFSTGRTAGNAAADYLKDRN